jgi:hypothetical protein
MAFFGSHASYLFPIRRAASGLVRARENCMSTIAYEAPVLDEATLVIGRALAPIGVGIYHLAV